MKKMMLILAVLAMVVATLSGCAGTMYHQQRVLPDGTILTQGGRTGVFGTDNSFVYITPSQSVPQVKSEVNANGRPAVVVERTYSVKEDSYKQNCPNIKQRHSIVHVDKKETWTEVVPPAVQTVQSVPAQSAPVFGFGTNSSVGNLAAPVAIGAAGYALGQKWRRPDNVNIGANATGGTGTGGAGGAGGISNAEAASASSSAADAEAWQNQGQWQRVKR